MPVFLGLALLLEIQGPAGVWATGGALGFLVCRVFYVPAYLSGIPGLRSFVWTASTLGLGCMVGSVLGWL